jgi:hypothetical protein
MRLSKEITILEPETVARRAHETGFWITSTETTAIKGEQLFVEPYRELVGVEAPTPESGPGDGSRSWVGRR